MLIPLGTGDRQTEDTQSPLEAYDSVYDRLANVFLRHMGIQVCENLLAPIDRFPPSPVAHRAAFEALLIVPVLRGRIVEDVHIVDDIEGSLECREEIGTLVVRLSLTGMATMTRL